MGDQRPEETVGSYRLTECRAEGHIARVCKGLDRTTMQKVIVRIVDPLACRNERLRAVLEDRDGVVWVAPSSGVGRSRDGRRFERLATPDGVSLGSVEFHDAAKVCRIAELAIGQGCDVGC